MPYKNREDQLAAQRRHYQRKKSYYVDKARKREVKIKKHVDDIKSNSKCVICEESHFSCLEISPSQRRRKRI
tara:strand:+ start:101153 stop:101368 length:216 start_codon:yes stop_codon:yes gene_type:complete